MNEGIFPQDLNNVLNYSFFSILSSGFLLNTVPVVMYESTRAGKATGFFH